MAEKPLNIHFVRGAFASFPACRQFLAKNLRSLPRGEHHVFILSEEAFGSRIFSIVSSRKFLRGLQRTLRLQGSLHVALALKQRLPQAAGPRCSNTFFFVSPRGLEAQPKRAMSLADHRFIAGSLGEGLDSEETRSEMRKWAERGLRLDESGRPFPRLKVGRRLLEGRICLDVNSPSEPEDAFSIVPSSEFAPSMIPPRLFRNRPLVFINDSASGPAVYYKNGAGQVLSCLVQGANIRDSLKPVLEKHGIRLLVHEA